QEEAVVVLKLPALERHLHLHELQAHAAQSAHRDAPWAAVAIRLSERLVELLRELPLPAEGPRIEARRALEVGHEDCGMRVAELARGHGAPVSAPPARGVRTFASGPRK